MSSPAPQAPDQLPVFNLAVPHRPARVHAVEHVDELPSLIAAATLDGERIHVIGAGHGLATPITSGTAVLTRGLNAVEVDPARRTARVGAGTRWAEVLEAAAPHGLAPVCGSAPGVGVVGFLLGGGLSPVGRTVGWGSEHVRSFELVTGASETVVASADRHPDLFWALRGGNAAPGVVTAVELDLLPLATLHGGGLFFDGADAAAVLSGWSRWVERVPDSVTSSVALLRLPDLETVPPPLRGRCVVHVRVAVVGEADPTGAVAPLRALATPIIDSVAEMPYGALGSIHADPAEPMPVLDGGILLRGFDTATVDALLAVAGPQTPAPFTVVEVRHLGGALSRTPAEPDAVAGRAAAFSLFVVSAPVPSLFAEVVPAAADRLFGALAPWTADGVLPNFVGSLNTAAADTAWPAEVSARLRDVHRTYDPAGVFADARD